MDSISIEPGPERRWTSAIVDGHVHLHTAFDVPAFLDAAARNLRMKGAIGGVSHDGSDALPLGVLAFTDMAGQDSLQRIRSECSGSWLLAGSGEEASLLMTSRCGNDSQSLLLVAGRQVVTAEKIEVLVLGTTDAIADGKPVDETIDYAIAAGGLPVLTWGFGKWLGPNASIIARLAGDIKRHPVLFFADSSVRLAHTPLPAGLRAAKAAGRIVLAGTDPLPIAQEETKAGRLAFKVSAPLSSDRPWSQLRKALLALTASPDAIGRFESPVTFVRHQLAMQIAKRIPATALTQS